MDEILNNISPAFHPAFTLIQRERMYLDEKILYAANFTRTGTGMDQWGFLIFTNKRYFKIYHLTQVSEDVWYKKVGIGLFRKSSEHNRRWIFPPKTLPPMVFKEQRVDEFYCPI